MGGVTRSSPLLTLHGASVWVGACVREPTEPSRAGELFSSLCAVGNSRGGLVGGDALGSPEAYCRQPAHRRVSGVRYWHCGNWAVDDIPPPSLRDAHLRANPPRWPHITGMPQTVRPGGRTLRRRALEIAQVRGLASSR